ncbi:hypothetical protein P5V15_010077 [Pogonomyrmex californicus]
MQFNYCIMIVLAMIIAIVTALSAVVVLQMKNYNPLENNLYEEDLLFPLLQLLMNGRRRHHVQNFLDVIHRKNDEEFREDFKLNRMIVYRLIVTLWFLSNKKSHRTLSNLFDISLSSVFRII